MNGYMENKVAGIIELNHELNEKANSGPCPCKRKIKAEYEKSFSENFKNFYNTLLLLFVI